MQATLTLEGGPIFWVATHRMHHQNTTIKRGTRTLPNDGGLWAHVGWLLTGETKHSGSAELNPYVPDLRKDKFHVWISRWHWIPITVLGILLLAFGGWPYLFWGIFFRTVVGLHSTWLVNSATHMWGSRRFATSDTSRNSMWVALLTFAAKDWHNNHHAHPQSSRHGLALVRVRSQLVWHLRAPVLWPGMGRQKLALCIQNPKSPPSSVPSRATSVWSQTAHRSSLQRGEEVSSPKLDKPHPSKTATLKKQKITPVAPKSKAKVSDWKTLHTFTGGGIPPRGAGGIGLHRSTRLDQDTRKSGELKRITAEVDPDLEMAEIADRTAKLHRGTSKAGAPRAPLRKRKEGHPGARVLMNQFGSERLAMRLALET